jgi:hypothetical protein
MNTVGPIAWPHHLPDLTKTKDAGFRCQEIRGLQAKETESKDFIET